MYNRRMHHERINEQEVPESQHTLFIRGFPGTVSTDEIKEFFEEKIGACSFDFIKVSIDRTKLFVAVRFEKKNEAKECYDRYRDSDVLGYPVEMSWFRDIRRYLSHIDKTGNSHSRHLKHYNNSYGGREERHNGTRSYTRSTSRSRSVSEDSHRSHSGSRSITRSRSPPDYSSLDLRNSDLIGHSISASPTPTKKSKKRKKTKKDRKRRISQSNSPPRVYGISNKNQSISDSDMETSDNELVAKKSFQNYYSQQQKEFKKDEGKKITLNFNSTSNPSTAETVNPVCFTDSDSKNGSKPKVRKIIQNENHDVNKDNTMRKNILENIKKEDTSPINTNILTFGSAMTNFKNIQRQILQDVRYKPLEQSDEEQIGTFRLSSLTTQKSSEIMREERIAKLSIDLREKVDKKKLQLELAYRHDCETFGLMTRKLISKDRSLEDRLRLALLEMMKDLEAEAIKQLDGFLDQLMFLTA